MRAIKIPAEASAPLEEVDIPAGYPQMNEHILGSSNDLIQEVRAKGLNHNVTETSPFILVMLVDEEGLIKQLPLNKRASVLYGTHVHGHPIVGDAWVIASHPEDWIALPPLFTPQAIHVLIDISVKFADEVFA